MKYHEWTWATECIGLDAEVRPTSFNIGFRFGYNSFYRMPWLRIWLGWLTLTVRGKWKVT